MFFSAPRQGGRGGRGERDGNSPPPFVCYCGSFYLRKQRRGVKEGREGVERSIRSFSHRFHEPSLHIRQVGFSHKLLLRCLTELISQT